MYLGDLNSELEIEICPQTRQDEGAEKFSPTAQSP